MSATVGQPAPDFTLVNQRNEKVTLSDLRGHKVVVVFFPFAFSSICTSELCELRDRREHFDEDTVLLGISVDSRHALRAMAEQEGLGYDLLSDFWPHGAVARAYGVFDESTGAASRGSFVIDREGIVRWAVVNDIGTPREADHHHTVVSTIP